MAVLTVACVSYFPWLAAERLPGQPVPLSKATPSSGQVISAALAQPNTYVHFSLLLKLGILASGIKFIV